MPRTTLSPAAELAGAIVADWHARCDARVAAGELVRLPNVCGERRYAVAGSPLALAAAGAR